MQLKNIFFKNYIKRIEQLESEKRAYEQWREGNEKIIKYFYDQVYPSLESKIVRTASFNLGEKNVYGSVVYVKCLNGVEFERLPVICMHGGSMWLCKECAEKMLEES